MQKLLAWVCGEISSDGELMGENFSKIKRKYFWAALVKSAICGAAIALLAVGAVLLALKIGKTPIAAGYYVLIALGGLLLGGGIAFLILMPTGKKVAARLDREYALGERVQTALEYEGRKGAVLELQRQDTEAALAVLPRRKLTFAKIWQYVVISALALALAFTAFFYPATPVAGVPSEDDAPFSVSQFQMSRLQTLIDNVKASYLEEELKWDTVYELEDLFDALVVATTVGELRTLVLGAADGVSEVLRSTSIHEPLVVALNAQKLGGYATTLTASARLYREVTILSFEQTNIFYRERFDHLKNVLRVPVSKLREALEEAAEGDAVFADVLTDEAATVTAALTLSHIDTESLLYGAFAQFAVGLTAISLAGYESAEEAEAALDTLYGRYTADVSDAMEEIAYDLVMNNYVANTLSSIFGVVLPPTGEEEENGPGSSSGGDVTDPSEGEDDPNGSGGALGGGEFQYPGNDEVYDPDSGEYVHYGELLDHYKSIIIEMLARGEITAEQAKYILDYFEILSGSAK